MTPADGHPRAAHASLLVRNTLLGAIQQAVGIGVGLVLTPLLLAYLGVEQYGVLLVVQILSVSGLLGVSDLGMQASLVRYLAGYQATGDLERFRGSLATGFALFIAIGVVCGLITLCLLYTVFFGLFHVPETLRGPASSALLVYASTFPFQFAIYVLKAFYFAVGDFPRLKAWESIERVLYIGALAVLLTSGGGLVGVVLVEQAVTIGLAGIFAAIASRRYDMFTLDISRVSPERLREIAELSRPLFLNYLATQVVYQRAPELITAALLGPVQVAYLGILTRVSRVLKAVGSAVNGAIFPAAAALDAQNLHEKLGRLLLRGGRYQYLLFTPLVVFLSYFAEELLHVWVGERFTFLANLLRMFVMWQYVMLLTFLLRSAFTRSDQYWAVMGPAVAGSAVFLGLAVALTWVRQDLWGIAVGLVVGAVVTVVGYLRFWSETEGFSLAEVWSVMMRGPVLLTGAGMYGFCALLGLWGSKPPVTVPYLGFVLVSAYAVHFGVVYRFGLSRMERRQFADGLRRVGGWA